jgi:hypothetical protein
MTWQLGHLLEVVDNTTPTHYAEFRFAQVGSKMSPGHRFDTRMVPILPKATASPVMARPEGHTPISSIPTRGHPTEDPRIDP